MVDADFYAEYGSVGAGFYADINRMHYRAVFAEASHKLAEYCRMAATAISISARK